MATNRKRNRTSENVTSDLGTEVALDLQGMDTCARTKKAYAGKVSTAISWFKTNLSDALNEEQTAFKLPISSPHLLGFFGHLCNDGMKRKHLKGPDEITDDMNVPMSTSTIQGYRSALVDLHKRAKIEVDTEANRDLTNMLDGYEKLIRQLKMKGLMKISEGKRPISGGGYSMLAEKFMKAKTDKVSGPENNKVATSWSATLFGWTFFVLMWNLMSRSDSVDCIMLQHIDWQGDSLLIEEQGQKGDQKGENKYWKHIYANPLEPAICPILSLAVFIFCSGFRPPDGRQQLFIGTNSKDRFAHQLHSLVQGLSEAEKDRLGCAPEDIGTHSERKGSSSYCLGQVAGPTPVSVFLRMGQSLGQLKDRYIFAGEGADQLCGRMVCGLPYSDHTFGILPPHFDNEVLALLTLDVWKEIIPGYENYPKSFRAAFPFLLASLVHHEPFLRANLRADHPLWTERLFTSSTIISSLRGKTLLGIGACPRTGLKATGIPPHLAIATKLKDLTDSLLAFRDSVMTVLDNFTTTLPEQIARKVEENLRQAFVINGVAPLTMRDIDSRFTVQHDNIRAILQEMIAAARQAPGPVALSPSVTRDTSREWWRRWDWPPDNQTSHYVPPDWKFPGGMTVKKLWDLWYYGDKSTGIRPYRLINKKLDIKCGPNAMQHNRAKSVMDRVANLIPARPDGTSVVVWKLSIVDADVVFEDAFKSFLDTIYCSTVDKTRKHELSYSTAYQLMVESDPEGLIVRKRVRKA